MKLALILEKTGHQHFNKFDCSQICYYDISKIETSMRIEWIRGLLKNYDYVIYPSTSNEAVAFETTLLEDDEEDGER
jgi:hypothetical protein